MQTASEFVRSLDMPYGAIGDRFTGNAVSQVESRNAEVRDQALDDAAKAVCPICKLDDDSEFKRLGEMWYHVKTYRDGVTTDYCEASAIHTLKRQG